MAGKVARAAGVFMVAYAAGSFAQSYDFQISNIRVEGVQRLEPGTVLTYLPVSVGDRMSEARAQQAIRALYDSGLSSSCGRGISEKRTAIEVMTVSERMQEFGTLKDPDDVSVKRREHNL